MNTKNTAIEYYARLKGVASDKEWRIRFLWALAAAGLAVAVYGGYRFTVYCRNRAALKELYGILDVYQEVQFKSVEGKQVDWSVLESDAEQSFEKHKKASLASWMLILESAAQRKQGDLLKGRDSMDRAVDLMHSSPVYGFVKVYDALLKLDSSDETVKMQGLEELRVLALDIKNIYADMALYHLGRYYWINDQIDEAKQVWQDLQDRYGSLIEVPSVWAQKAQTLLEQVG